MLETLIVLSLLDILCPLDDAKSLFNVFTDVWDFLFHYSVD